MLTVNHNNNLARGLRTPTSFNFLLSLVANVADTGQIWAYKAKSIELIIFKYK